MKRGSPSTWSLDGVSDSLSFARSLSLSEIVSFDPDGVPIPSANVSALSISFEGAGRLAIQDIATIALVARTFAHAGTTVEILLAKDAGRSFALSRFLSRIGFFHLFADSSLKWTHLVKASSTRLRWRRARPAADTHYIPLRWFDESMFQFDQGVSPELVRPRVSETLESDLRSVLLEQGFLDGDALDALLHVLFLEVGWNSVLHSQAVAGRGFGVLCGQIDHRRSADGRWQQPELSFCIADLGVGIPYRLKERYIQSRRQYHDAFGVSSATGAVRFSLDRDATSRTHFPSVYDEIGARGLAHVASVLRATGGLTLRSCGGSVELAARTNSVNYVLRDWYRDSPIPGTQLVGYLRPVEREQESVTRSKRSLPDVRRVARLCGFDGAPARYGSAADALRLAADLAKERTPVVLDLGYSDADVRHLEYLCRALVDSGATAPIVFWNVRTSRVALDPLISELAQSPAFGKHSWLFVRSHLDAFAAGGDIPTTLGRRASGNRRNGASELFRIALHLDEYQSIAKAVNDLFVTDGFRIGGTRDGFFVGRIHSVAGQPVDAWFSLLANTSRVPANLMRWTQFVAASVAYLRARSAPEDSFAILGVGAAVRSLIDHLWYELGMRIPAHCVLTSDVPAKEELASIVSETSRLIIVTDTIARSDAIEAVIEAITGVGGRAIGAIALADRRPVSQSSGGAKPVGTNSIPIEVAFRIPARADTKGELTEYWVDPVSSIPQRTPSGYWSALDSRVAQTLRLIDETGAAKCGHLVEGSRHSTIYIDVRSLVIKQEAQIAHAVEERLRQRLLREGWEAFRPDLVLYPSNYRRVESVQSGISNEPNTRHHTAARVLASLLAHRHGNVPAVEVAREFDADGNSMCTRSLPHWVEQLALRPSDVLVVDDGIWSGQTSRALLELAASVGAQRVVVMTLLARLSPPEMVHYEAIDVVRFDERTSVRANFVMPLWMPVGYHDSQTCPYELTIGRLRRKARGDDHVSFLGTEYAGTLLGRPGPALPEMSKQFTRTWMRLRAYAELATSTKRAVDWLGASIGNLATVEEREALLRLFLEDWRLLSRPRLRHSVWPLVREKANESLRDGRLSSSGRRTALSLIRSLYPRDFLQALEAASDHIATDITSLERAVFHIATAGPSVTTEPANLRTPAQRLRDRAMAHLTKIRERGDKKQLERYRACLTTLTTLLLEISPHRARWNSRDAARAVYQLLTREPTLGHDTRGELRLLAAMQPSLGILDTQHFKLMNQMWVDNHYRWLQNELLPPLLHLGAVLRAAADSVSDAVPQQALDYVAGRLDHKPVVTRDLASITWQLATLAQGLLADSGSIATCAERVAVHVTETDSLVVRLLGALRVYSIESLIRQLELQLSTLLDAAGWNVSLAIRNETSVSLERMLFVSPSVLSLCLGCITSNMVDHAYSGNEARRDATVLVDLSTYSNANEEFVRFVFLNDGKPLPAKWNRGSGVDAANARLEIFGGRMHGPFAATEPPFTVGHVIELALW